jgi:hypothetical protein
VAHQRPDLQGTSHETRGHCRSGAPPGRRAPQAQRAPHAPHSLPVDHQPVAAQQRPSSACKSDPQGTDQESAGVVPDEIEADWLLATVALAACLQ